MSKSEEENSSLVLAAKNAAKNLENFDRPGIEKDSLDMNSLDKADQFKVQSENLEKENDFLRSQLAAVTEDFELLLEKVYQKKYDILII